MRTSKLNRNAICDLFIQKTMFMFVSRDGTISTRNPAVDPTNAIQKVPKSTMDSA